MDIHPPAHVLVVPPDSEAWTELMRLWGTFESSGLPPPPKRTKAEEIERKRKKREYEDLDL